MIRGYSSKARCSWILLVAALGAGVSPAHALVIPIAELLNTSVPANGVLRFSMREGVTLRVIAADGSEVSGSFIATGVWRPDEPFALGTYTADLNWVEHPSWTRDGTFEVTPALDLDAEFVRVVVEPRVDADGERILEQECCLEGQSRSPEPCDGACPPLCVPTIYGSKQVVSVTTQVPAHVETQFEAREVPTMIEAGEFSTGYWDVVGSPDELCGVVQVFRWIDESTQTVRRCVANPKPALPPLQSPIEGFGNGSDCTIPPAGYEPLWCEERAYLCLEWLLTPEGAQNEETARACEHYGDVCLGGETDAGSDVFPGSGETAEDVDGVEPPTGEGGMAPMVDVNADGRGGEPELRGIESAKGCAVGPLSGGPRRAPALVTLLTVCGFVSRIGRSRRDRAR